MNNKAIIALAAVIALSAGLFAKNLATTQETNKNAKLNTAECILEFYIYLIHPICKTFSIKRFNALQLLKNIIKQLL